MFPIENIRPEVFSRLCEIPDVPKQLFMRGTLPDPSLRILTVVGSRNYTNYGKQCVQHLISGLRGYPISIVSGLALGIDALAHEAALENGLHTIAVPGSGLDDSVLYPRTNRGLATQILKSGGLLMSEFEPETASMPWMFPARNRIVVGIANAVLLIEAAERSGTLITARLATEYNRDLLVVPGNIFSENTRGVHQFLKLGATPVTSAADILEALHIPERTAEAAAPSSRYADDSPEAALLAALIEPTPRDMLVRALATTHGMDTATATTLLMKMEFAGDICSDQGVVRRA